MEWVFGTLQKRLPPGAAARPEAAGQSLPHGEFRARLQCRVAVPGPCSAFVTYIGRPLADLLDSCCRVDGEKRAAVGRSAHDRFGCNVAGCSCPVFDNEWLPSRSESG
jgi:hypothetical protein